MWRALLNITEDKAADLKHWGQELLHKIREGTEGGTFKCQYCGAPHMYRENLEIHEAGCPKQMSGHERLTAEANR